MNVNVAACVLRLLAVLWLAGSPFLFIEYVEPLLPDRYLIKPILEGMRTPRPEVLFGFSVIVLAVFAVLLFVANGIDDQSRRVQ